jgi:hypothetical protein
MLDFESAKAAAHLAIELREQDLSLHVELGRVYFGMRRFDDAIEEYDLVLDKVPGEVAAVIAKSAALRASRRAEEAERQVTAMRRTLPWNRDPLAELGWTRFDQRDWRRARADFKELLRSASNPRERAAASYGLGWVAYSPAAHDTPFREARPARTSSTLAGLPSSASGPTSPAGGQPGRDCRRALRIPQSEVRAVSSCRGRVRSTDTSQAMVDAELAADDAGRGHGCQRLVPHPVRQRRQPDGARHSCSAGQAAPAPPAG